METMGNRIHEKRIEKGYTMEELGNLVGVQKSAVNKWEKNMVQNIKRSAIAKLAEILDCDPIWLMYGNDDNFSALEKEIIYKYRTSPHQSAILSLLGITDI